MDIHNLHVRFVAEPGGRYTVHWQSLARAGRRYWRAWVTDAATGTVITRPPLAGCPPERRSASS